MFRYFTLTVLSILFCFQSISQILQPCATDIYNDQKMQNDPSFAINLQNAENQISAKGGQLNTQSTVVTIPVVVHIVYNTTAQNISDAQVQSQIDALNEDFRMLNSDTGNVPAAFKHLVTDAQIEFCLAQRDPLGNPTTGITRTFTNETSFSVDNKIKYTSQGGHDIWDRNQYMNIWVGPLGGSLGGYAQFPGGSAASDGIVVNTIVFGRAPYVSGAYSKGRVTVHEVGHWLNLRHLWGSGSCGDDLVTDTPIHAGANYGCPTFPKLSSCSGGDPNGELFMNHMDYTADACKVMFSADQVARMNANLSPGGLRYSLLSSLGCQAPTGNPVCDTPTNINASNITNTSAQLSWIGAGANSYTLRIRETGTTTWTSGTSTGAVINATGLTAATQYDFEVQSECTGLNSSWSGIYNFTTSGGICDTPTGLTVTNISTTSAQLNWNSTGATSYNIQYKVDGTSTWTPTTSSGASVTINSLASGTQYDFQVQSDCNGTLSSWSSVANFTTTTATPTCDTPIGLAATNITTTSAQLNWNSTGATSYNIQYRVNGASTWTSATSFSGTSISINSLASGTQYNYQLQSNCNGTLSSWSSVANFTTTTATPACNTPTGLTATNITTTSTQLNWNSTGATSYNIQYKVNGASTWTSATSFSGTSISINSLASGTQYNYQLQSNCNGTLSSWSSVANFTTTTATPTCNTPTGLTATNITTTSVQLNWNSTGATSYNIQYKVNGASTWTSATSFSGPSISINSLASGTQYNYQLKSNCNGTLSSWSSVANFTTTTATPTCNTPLGLTANNITYNSAQLNWNSTGALSYKIQYKINGSSSWTLITSNTNSITINSLTAVTQYVFQLQSACSGGLLSSWSSGNNFTTLAPCGEPTLINTDSISVNSATINWNSTGATSYELRLRKVNELNWSYNITSATSFYITGLDTNTTYEYQISSICNGSNSAYSSIQNFTTLELCDNPVSVSLITSSQSTLTLQWNPTGAATYELRFRPEGTSVWYFAIATSELIILTGLIPQTPYDIQVRSLCNSNNSNYSTLQSYQTSPLCVDPSAINIALQGHGTVIISWISSNSLHYEFRYRASGTANWNSATVSTNHVELSNLNPATDYDFEVRSICNAVDTSGYSQTVTFNSTVVSSINHENMSTSVYPNPVKNLLFIETGIPDVIDVTILNLMGAKINQLRINPTSGRARIDVSGLAPGTYLLRISSGKSNFISRIVKTNS